MLDDWRLLGASHKSSSTSSLVLCMSLAFAGEGHAHRHNFVTLSPSPAIVSSQLHCIIIYVGIIVIPIQFPTTIQNKRNSYYVLSKGMEKHMAHQIYEQSPINTDPREQRNYQMYSHSGRSRTPRLIRNLALTLIILGAIATGLTFYGLTAPRTAAILPEHTFNVSGHTELIVNNDAGSIHIHSASTNSIVVHGTKYASGIGPDVNAIDVQYEQQGNSVFVTSKEGWGI